MSESQFRSAIKDGVRGLYGDIISPSEFDEHMEKTLRRHLSIAWKEGALECGIGEDELSDHEKTTRDGFISNQLTFVGGLTVAIVEQRKAGDPIGALMRRVDQWVQRYPEAKAIGHAMACADQKAEFVYGPTKEHCGSCRGLRGRVYRYSVWVKNNAVPPHNWRFECRGGCRCSLQTTDKPITKGKFPVGLLK